MRFEWDERKNLLNIRDHKIDFQDVPSVFQGPVLIDLDDREDYGEDRWIGIGMLRDIPVVIQGVCQQIQSINYLNAPPYI